MIFFSNLWNDRLPRLAPSGGCHLGIPGAKLATLLVAPGFPGGSSADGCSQASLVVASSFPDGGTSGPPVPPGPLGRGPLCPPVPLGSPSVSPPRSPGGFGPPGPPVPQAF